MDDSTDHIEAGQQVFRGEIRRHLEKSASYRLRICRDPQDVVADSIEAVARDLAAEIRRGEFTGSNT